jgi:hypothetical protein
MKRAIKSASVIRSLRRRVRRLLAFPDPGLEWRLNTDIDLVAAIMYDGDLAMYTPTRLWLSTGVRNALYMALRPGKGLSDNYVLS